MSPDIKFFGSEEKVHVEGQVDFGPTPKEEGKEQDYHGKILYVATQEDADILTPLIGQEMQMIDSNDIKINGRKGGIQLFSPPARLDKVEVKK